MNLLRIFFFLNANAHFLYYFENQNMYSSCIFDTKSGSVYTIHCITFNNTRYSQLIDTTIYFTRWFEGEKVFDTYFSARLYIDIITDKNILKIFTVSWLIVINYWLYLKLVICKTIVINCNKVLKNLEVTVFQTFTLILLNDVNHFQIMLIEKKRD